MGLDMKDRRTSANEVGARCRKTGKKEKTKIPDEFTANTGRKREYAIRILANRDKITGDFETGAGIEKKPRQEYSVD